jgi:hypothetical protein
MKRSTVLLVFIAGCSSFGIRTSSQVLNIEAREGSTITLDCTAGVDGAEIDAKVPFQQPQVALSVGQSAGASTSAPSPDAGVDSGMMAREASYDAGSVR